MKNPHREKLKPCPFCGSPAALKLNCAVRHLPHVVECQRCHGRTTIFRIKSLAVSAWNNRVVA